jgi:hypothetical protein
MLLDSVVGRLLDFSNWDSAWCGVEVKMSEINVNIVGTEARKRVRFSDVDLLATYHMHDDASSTTSSNHEEPSTFPLTSSQKSFKIRERRSQASLASDFRGRYLSIQPGDELVFERKKDPDHESSDVIRLVNIATDYVAFKVKTTAPEKFRVRPSFGCIESGGSKTVEVTVQPGYLMTAQRDRFLVMSIPLAEEPRNHDDLVEYWHDTLKDGLLQAEIEEHRLRCTVVAPPADLSAKHPGGSPAEPVLDHLLLIDSKLDFLLATKKATQTARRKMQWNLLTLGFAVVLLFFSSRLVFFLFAQDDQPPSKLPNTIPE